MAPAETPTGLSLSRLSVGSPSLPSYAATTKNRTWNISIAPPGTNSALTCSLTWPPCSHERSEPRAELIDPLFAAAG